MKGTVRLKVLSRLEDFEAGTEMVMSAADLETEIDKGLHKRTKRPLSPILNHCEVIEADGKAMSAYRAFAKGVKAKTFVPGVDTTRPENDPFHKEDEA